MTTKEQPKNMKAMASLPDYMTKNYHWAYINPSHVAWLDRNLVVNFLLFFNAKKLIRSYLAKIKPGMCIWQLAHVYGDLVRLAAEKTGQEGHFWLNDITPIQVQRAEAKLAKQPWAKVWLSDASTFSPPGEPDLICSFFLLHEVPDEKKRAIVSNILKHLPIHGEALFVDYSRPCWWQPAGWLLRLINHLLEPFAYSLWQHDISDFVSLPETFVWQKTTVFGGVYQVVSVRHKLCGK